MESSSYQVLKQKKSSKKLISLSDDIIPISIEWDWKVKQPMVKLSNGEFTPSSCIHCINPPCIEYSEDEFFLETFQLFPRDKNLEVCPTKAISWPQDSNSPIIDSEMCITCGLCVSRCPVAAIYLDPEKGTAILNDQPNDYFQHHTEEVTEELQKPLLERFSGITENGIFVLENDSILQKFFDKFKIVTSRQSAQFPNHLVRNLMIEIGINALMSRRGDTNIRMDIVFEQVGKTFGTCEVEFGNGILDAPRNLLDNVAVLISRYKMSQENMLPLVVTFSLPNQRSEYWKVIKDIRKVLDLKINSLTVGMLILLIWNRIKVSLDDSEVFYVDSDQYSIREKFESILGRKVNVTEGYPGLLECQK